MFAFITRPHTILQLQEAEAWWGPAARGEIAHAWNEVRFGLCGGSRMPGLRDRACMHSWSLYNVSHLKTYLQINFVLIPLPFPYQILVTASGCYFQAAHRQARPAQSVNRVLRTLFINIVLVRQVNRQLECTREKERTGMGGRNATRPGRIGTSAVSRICSCAWRDLAWQASDFATHC